jgi:hypothetical protein
MWNQLLISNEMKVIDFIKATKHMYNNLYVIKKHLAIQVFHVSLSCINVAVHSFRFAYCTAIVCVWFSQDLCSIALWVPNQNSYFGHDIIARY